MAFSFFSSRKKKSPEARFWTWFEKNQDMLFSFERDTERTFNKLAGKMSKVHGDLTFEFGPDRDGVREFVISAGGMLDAFPTVELLHDSAPDLKRWMFTKFRPRRTPMTWNTRPTPASLPRSGRMSPRSWPRPVVGR